MARILRKRLNMMRRQSVGAISGKGQLITYTGSSERTPNLVTANGGQVQGGVQFTIDYSPGGLTGTVGCALDGVACSGYSVTNDTTATAIAPVSGLSAGIKTLEISY